MTTDLDEATDKRVTMVSGGAWSSQTEKVTVSRSKVQWLVWLIFVAVIAGILAVGYVGWWYVDKVYPATTAPEEVDFTVTADDTVETVSERLYNEQLVTDPEVFIWYAERQGGLELVPGYYQLTVGENMGEVLERLSTPPGQTYHRVTFPEGFTLTQMGVRLEEEDPRLSAAAFDEAASDGTITSRYSPPDQPSLEGLLFPDTYQISNADNAGQVVERMVGLMERVGEQENIEQGAAALNVSPYQILIIASIIEKEAKLDEDRPKIARVIYNRLFLDTELQIDATVYYGQPADFEGEFAQLREINTPYNSYLNKGLPPTPIANPGRASIRAALNPAPNPTDRDAICKADPVPDPCMYLYYVLADKDGSHAFAATPEQHEANVAAANAKGLL